MNEYATELWSGLIECVKNQVVPPDGLMIECWKAQANDNNLLKTIGCVFKEDGETPDDIFLFHLNNGLTDALGRMEAYQVLNILTVLKKRYAKLAGLHRGAVYGSVPDWFTGQW